MESTTEQSNQPAYTSYEQVPWYRKNWFALVCGLFFSPGLLPTLITGNFYYQKNGQISEYSKFAKVALIIWSLFGVGAITAKVYEAIGAGSSLPEEISGVWREDGANTLIVLNGSGKEMQMAVNGQAIPVTLGDVDEQNGIVNLNAVDLQGNAMIWTIRQVWNEKHEGFNLSITMHDGSQSNLSFVRKPSPSDLAPFAQQQAQQQSQSTNQAPETTASESPVTTPASSVTEVTVEGTIDVGTDLSSISPDSGDGYSFPTDSAIGKAIFQQCQAGVRCHVVASVDGENVVSVKSAVAIPEAQAPASDAAAAPAADSASPPN